jgi:hypothetical protein
MKTLSERTRARFLDMFNADSDAAGDSDAATLDAIGALDAAQVALQDQFHRGEITQGAYDEQWSSLIETTPPAVLKASMEPPATLAEAPRSDSGVAKD